MLSTNNYSTDTIKQHEDLILLHRYCYYVLCDPIISDFIYDQLETEARKVCPETSVVHKVGSVLSSSYPDYIKELAKTKYGKEEHYD